MEAKEFVKGELNSNGFYQYRSLYDYLKLYKKYKKVSPIYKSAFLQNREGDSDNTLIIACENYDYESMVSDENYDRICRRIEKHLEDILKLYDKKYWCMRRYSYE